MEYFFPNFILAMYVFSCSYFVGNLIEKFFWKRVLFKYGSSTVLVIISKLTPILKGHIKKKVLIYGYLR